MISGAERVAVDLSDVASWSSERACFFGFGLRPGNPTGWGALSRGVRAACGGHGGARLGGGQWQALPAGASASARGRLLCVTGGATGAWRATGQAAMEGGEGPAGGQHGGGRWQAPRLGGCAGA